MKLEQSFEVAAPLELVWQALIDVERVAPCLPGAAVAGQDEDGSYEGTFSVKIGPTTASYAGKLKLEQVDEAERTATLQANGTDRRGQGGARATITSRLHASDGGGTRVEVVTDYQITGRLARFGRGGMIEDIAERLLMEFAQRLQASLMDEDGEPASSAAGPSQAPAAPADEPGAPSVSTATAAEAPRPAPTPVEPLEGGSLVASVLWDRTRRNPAGLVAALAGLLMVLALVRRKRR